MNPRVTWWLSGLAAGLFVYIYFVDLRPGRSAPLAAEQRPLLPDLDPGKVTRVEIARSNEVIRAELVQDQWQLVNPVYPAQGTAIQSFLRTLATLKRQSEIPAQEIIAESGGLSPFGLDPAWAVIKLQTATGQTHLKVGAKTLLGDRVYVQPVGSAGIFTADAALVGRVPQSASQWRNPILLQPSTLVFDRIAVTAGSRVPLKLERDATNQLWRLVEPMRLRADFGRVEYLIQQLRSARVHRFISDDPKQDVDAFGLQPPEAELSLAFGSNTVFQMQFGKSPTNDASLVYARILTRTNVVLVSRELADLVEKPYTEFRDRVLISFRPSLVDRIEAQITDESKPGQPSAAGESYVVQRQGEEAWEIAAPFRAPADRQLMQLFLEDLGKLEIINFGKEVVTDFAPFGLLKPSRQYVLKTTVTNATGLTNQTLLQVDFGASPPNEPDKVYCRRSDETSVYVVGYADMARLQRSAFALRDRRIWNFAGSNIVGITVSQRNQRRHWTRDPVSRAWARGDQIAEACIEESLHRLGQLQAEAWVARGEDQAKLLKTDGSEYQMTLDLAEKGQTRPLVLNLRLGLRGQPYGATLLDGELVTFKVPPSVYATVLQCLSVASNAVEL